MITALSDASFAMSDRSFSLRRLSAFLRSLSFVALLFLAAGSGIARADPMEDFQSQSAAFAQGLAAAASGKSASDIPGLMIAADVARQQSDFYLAASYMTQIAGIDPNRYPVWLQLAKDMASAGNREIAVLAAYRAHVIAETVAQQSEALNAAAEWLLADRRYDDAVAFLELSMRIAPNATTESRLAYARASMGFHLLSMRAETSGETAEICMTFSDPMSADATIEYGDYVRSEPEVAMTFRATDADLCVGGFDFGADYKIRLLAGLPGADGISLEKGVEQNVATGDRASSLGFRTAAYVLPSGAGGEVPLISVNVATAEIRVLRINDRNLVSEIDQGRFLRNLDEYDRDYMAESSGELVWEGRMDLANERNKRNVTNLPFGEIVPQAKPGVYIVMARNAEFAPGSDRYEWTYGRQATQWLIVSDIGLTAFSGADGLTIMARSLASGKPLRRVDLQLIARNNEVLAQARTDGDGLAHFDPGLIRGEGGRAAITIMAFRRDGDYSFLDLTETAFDLSDRGVGGRPPMGDRDLYFYTDRGVYRPGETVHVMALLRDAAAKAVTGEKLIFRLLRPDGVEMARYADATERMGGYALDIDISPTAVTGSWTIEAYIDPAADPIASLPILVEDVVPARIEAKLQAFPTELHPDDDTETPYVEIAADYLFGAPAAGAKVASSLAIDVDPAPFADFADYRFGLEQENFSPVLTALDDTVTDATGKAVVDIAVDEWPESSHPLLAEFRADVLEFGGRPVSESLTLPIRNHELWLGIKPLFANGEVAYGSAAQFEIVGLDADGKSRAVGDVEYRLIEEDWDYVWSYRNQRWDYTISVRDKPAGNGTLTLDGAKPSRLDLPVGWGSYRLEIYDAASGVASSYRFYAGWQAKPGDSGTPDKMQIVADSETYSADGTAQIFLKAPFAGTALVTIATDRILDSFPVSLPAEGKTIKIAIDPAWGAGAYILVNAYRPGVTEAAAPGPGRAIGVTWLAIDPAPRRLAVEIAVPEMTLPRQSIEIPVKIDGLAGGEAYLTLAAVDEGILQLTDFATPDPLGYFFAKRRLGLDIRDLYGRLIEAQEGERGILRQGGDAERARLAGAPKEVKLVALFSGTVALDAEGKATIKLDIPDYNGRLRLMAVAWNGEKLGAGERALIVRDPVIVLSSTPRVLAPGDKSALSLSIQNLDGAAGRYRLSLRGHDGLILDGAETYELDLPKGGQADLRVNLAAEGLGEGAIDLAIAGPDGFALNRRIAIPIRPATAYQRTILSRRLMPGESLAIDGIKPGVFVSSTAQMGVTFSPHPDLDVASILNDLSHYPYGCLEQTISTATPLLLADEVAHLWGRKVAAGDNAADAAQIDRAIGRVLEMQRYDGAFGLWSGYDPREDWLSAYALDFLLTAKARGHYVPDYALANGLDNLAALVLNYHDESPESFAARAYALYVLTKAKRASLSDLRYLADNYLDTLPTGMAQAQLGAALAMSGDLSRARAAFERAIAKSVTSRIGIWDYGTDLRDLAGIVALMAESRIPDLDPSQYVERLSRQISGISYFSTQEQVWILRAALALSSEPTSLNIARSDGSVIESASPYLLQMADAEIATGSQFVNRGAAPVYATITIDGLPLIDPPPANRDLTIAREYYYLDGRPADLTKLTQGDILVAVIKGRTLTTGDYHLLLVDLLPGGFEIENQRLAHTADDDSLPWLPELSNADYVEFRDDRYVASIRIDRRRDDADEFAAAYIVRVVSPGTYKLPAVAIEDMYHPQSRARGQSGEIAIAPAK